MAHPDFEEFLAALNDADVRYLIGGAHALALHARPRATKDLDIVIAPTLANARRAESAIKAFFGGVAPQVASAENLLDADSIVQLGVAPVRIDILSHFGSIRRFSHAWKRRVDARFGSVPAHFLGRDDLIAEKMHWARPQDLADVYVLRHLPKRRTPGKGTQSRGQEAVSRLRGSATQKSSTDRRPPRTSRSK